MTEAEFKNLLAIVACERRFVRLQYFADNHEFFRLDTLIEKVDEHSIVLSNGDAVPVMQLFSVNNHRAPGYAEEEDFSCDC